MQTAIGIFAKTPGLSPIKTRLAREIGETAALDFYRLSLRATEAVVHAASTQDPRIVPYWAIAEPAPRSEFWSTFNHSQRLLHQVSEGEESASLGQRLDNVYHRLLSTHGSVILLGTDSPLVSSEELVQAALCIREKPGFAIAPAADGGFIHFSGSLAIPRPLWLQVTYSAPTTWRELVEAITPLHALGKSCTILSEGVDVDTLDDLKLLLDFRLHQPQQRPQHQWLPEQAALVEWVESFLGCGGGEHSLS